MGEGWEEGETAILYYILGGAVFTSEALRAGVGTGRSLIAVYTIHCEFADDSLDQRNRELGGGRCYLRRMEPC